MLGVARELIDRKTARFIESGAAHLDEIIACYQQQEALKAEAESDFPLSEGEILTCAPIFAIRCCRRATPKKRR